MFEFSNETKEYLSIVKKQYQLSNYEYTNLLSLLLTRRIITHDAESIDDINYFIQLIINNRNRTIINDNTNIYNGAIQYIVTNYFNTYGISEDTFKHITNNWFNGYNFHTLNSVFVKDIDAEGIKLDNKPWDVNEIKEVIRVLKRNIFGMFNGNTGVFFASNLKTSPYYGLSSPTFYRKFVENKPEYLNVFLDRNLFRANESIQKLCDTQNLTDEERDIIVDFFKKYWLAYASEELPCVLMRKRKKTSDIPYPSTNVVNYTIDLITKDDNNTYIKNDIARDELEIFSYEALGIVSQYTKEK